VPSLNPLDNAAQPLDSALTLAGASGRQFPSTTVQVAFQNNPFDVSLTWTDITQYVQGFSTTMGRQHELQQVNPSTATITLVNEPVGPTNGGRFSPWNTGSPYYYSGTGLTPGHPIRITATWQGITYPVFYGYIKSWIPAYSGTRSSVQLQCYDVLALLNLNTMDTGQYETTVIATPPVAYYQLADGFGATSAVDTMGGAAAVTSGGASVAFGQPGLVKSDATTSAFIQAGSNLRLASGVVSGTHVSVTGWIDTSYSSTVHNIVWLTGAVQLILGTNSGAGQASGTIGGVSVFGGPNVCDGQIHFLALTYDGKTIRVYVDGALVAFKAATASVTATTALLAVETTGNQNSLYAHIAIYNVVLTQSQIVNQYAIATAGWVQQDSGARVSAVLGLAGVPAVQKNIGAGNIQVQAVTAPPKTQSVMSYLNTIVATERGMLYQDASGVVQFRNRHYVYENSAANTSNAVFGYSTGLRYLAAGIVPGIDDVDLWNNIPVAKQGGQAQTAADATSQLRYGKRTLSGYSSLLFVYDQDASTLAGGLLYQYKAPMSRVRSLSVDSTISSGVALPQMLGRRLLDRITIQWRPLDGSSVDFNQQSLIEQITHTVTPEVWTTTFAVTPIGTEAFWIIGTGVLGTGILGI
jgi:hypothetical protein